MRILFIYPPMNRISIVPANHEPLAFEILTATVPQHTVDFIDLRFEPPMALARKIASFKPKIAGITVNNTIDVNQSLKTIRKLRCIDQRVKIIVGGRHASLVSSYFFLLEVDAVFVGWAERSFPRYVAQMKSSADRADIPGVIIVHKGEPDWPSAVFDEIEETDIPPPIRPLSQKYQNYYVDELGRRSILVNTTRGCRYRCTFCACWKSVNGQYFSRSAERVIEELRELPPEARFVSFADDNTFQDVERAKKLYSLIKQSRIQNEYCAYCRSNTVVRYPELFRAWQEVGLRNLVVGFETATTGGLEAYNKCNTERTNREASKILNSLGLGYDAYFIIEPDFDRSDFRKLYGYVKRLHLSKPRFPVLTPLPGTLMYEQKKRTINRGYDFFDFVHWVYPPKLNEIVFFRLYARLYRKTHSFGSYVKILIRSLHRFVTTGQFPQDHIPFLVFVRRWIIFILCRSKIYRTYFG